MKQLGMVLYHLLTAKIQKIFCTDNNSTEMPGEMPMRSKELHLETTALEKQEQ